MTNDLSAVARSAKLDDAIDQVAKQLTHVDEDAALAARIVAALPDRPTWFGWLIGSWTPRFAMIALIIATGVFLNRAPKSVASIPGTLIAGSFAPVTFVASVNPEPPRTMPLEHLERVKPLEPLDVEKPDHQFSLPSLASVAALSMKSLSPDALPEEGALSIAPLAIADLALDPVQR